MKPCSFKLDPTISCNKDFERELSKVKFLTLWQWFQKLRLFRLMFYCLTILHRSRTVSWPWSRQSYSCEFHSEFIATRDIEMDSRKQQMRCVPLSNGNSWLFTSSPGFHGKFGLSQTVLHGRLRASLRKTSGRSPWPALGVGRGDPCPIWGNFKGNHH